MYLKKNVAFGTQLFYCDISAISATQSQPRNQIKETGILPHLRYSIKEQHDHFSVRAVLGLSYVDIIKFILYNKVLRS